MNRDKWLDEALAQLPAKSIRQSAEDYLRPLMKRCRAATRSRFWQWLKLQLAKDNEMVSCLGWMSESNLQPEIVKPHQREGFRYVVNGDVALIEVIDGPEQIVWRVPLSRLDWALSMYPVFLKRLPDLEPPEVAQRRQLERRLKTRLPFLKPEQQQAILDEIEDLNAKARRAFAPVPRFMLVKYAGGGVTGVHRIYLDAGPQDEVEPLDGDFTNFTTVTVPIKIEPVNDPSGFAVRKGDRPPVQHEKITLPNLYIVNSSVAQAKFDDGLLQDFSLSVQ